MDIIFFEQNRKTNNTKKVLIFYRKKKKTNRKKFPKNQGKNFQKHFLIKMIFITQNKQFYAINNIISIEIKNSIEFSIENVFFYRNFFVES